MSGEAGHLSAYDSIDPAPALTDPDAPVMGRVLLDPRRSLFDRMRALFGLRNEGSARAVALMGRALRTDPSALLRHEVAFVFGQMGHDDSVPFLIEAATSDRHPMVRHEAVEALGNHPTARPEALLRRILETDEDREVRESAQLALANLAYLRDADAF